MTVFTAIVELTKASWQVLRRHPLLIWFPILSLVATLMIVAFLIPMLAQLEDVPWIAILVLMFSIHLVHVFFNVGLTSEALRALRGDTPITIGAGLSTACGRVPAIASYAAVSATFGFVLELMGRSRNGAFRLARAVFGTGWSLVTYLAIPVMVQERRGGIPSLKRSGELFRRTWGETTLAEVGVRVLTQYVMGVLVIVAIVLLHLFGQSLGSILVILCLAAAAVGVIGALEAVYRCALYVFASEGVVPAAFAVPELDEIWHVKPGEPSPAEPSPGEPPPLDV
jgi:hypothetical protein